MFRVTLYGILVITGMIISCRHEIPPLEQPETIIESTVCSSDTVYFQQAVLPIFISNCTMAGCHDAASHEEGIVLTSYTSIMNTGKIRPFQPFNSDIYKKIIDTDPNDRMPPPPASALTQEQRDLVFKWIAQGALNNSCQSACDTSVYTFSAGIRPVITARCQGCHSGGTPQGGISLTTYQQVKARVEDGKLWGSINHLAGYSPMPKNGNKLSDCELKKFEKWIAAGSPDN
ncbi:MAG TPA: c-type cytochrome domain-containing protein [Flavisolibacter sp.]